MFLKKPQAAIVTSTSVVEGYKVIFNGLQSNDNDKIAEYKWDFGDGLLTKYGPTLEYVYHKAGEYNVTLPV